MSKQEKIRHLQLNIQYIEQEIQIKQVLLSSIVQYLLYQNPNRLAEFDKQIEILKQDTARQQKRFDATIEDYGKTWLDTVAISDSNYFR